MNWQILQSLYRELDFRANKFTKCQVTTNSISFKKFRGLLNDGLQSHGVSFFWDEQGIIYIEYLEKEKNLSIAYMHFFHFIRENIGKWGQFANNTNSWFWINCFYYKLLHDPSRQRLVERRLPCFPILIYWKKQRIANTWGWEKIRFEILFIAAPTGRNYEP
jgi:hypothetical protein